MVRTAFVSVVALSASANAFLAPVPGYSLARTSRASVSKLNLRLGRVEQLHRFTMNARGAKCAPIQMVTSATPAVSTGGGNMVSNEETYTAALKKMEAESLAELEKAFEETAKKAKAESDKIWSDLEAEFAQDVDEA